MIMAAYLSKEIGSAVMMDAVMPFVMITPKAKKNEKTKR